MSQVDWLGLPKPSDAILRDIRAVHPGLYVLRSRYALEQSTGKVAVDARTRQPFEKPRYWIWIDNRGRKSPLFPVETPQGEFMELDGRTVRRLATDLGVACSEYEAWRALEDAEEQRELRRQESERERVRRFFENNPRAVREAIQNMKDGVVTAPREARMRDAVIYSYDGQPIRSSSHGTVPTTARERGIDSPEA